jgi:nitroimidazol reductase NimA-like FMN-containing flavoprotein (pyridoxamine 5'-phosphate oxidase superfamily)
MGDQQSQMTMLTREECLALLASVPLGRVVFTLNALPAIRPVNHLMDDENIIIRSHVGSGITSAATPRGEVVVAYEADQLDVDSRTGWSVVVTGLAQLVADPAEIARYELALHPWVNQPMNTVIRIRPELVTGFQLVPLDHNGSAAAG